MLEGEDFAALVFSIEKFGQQVPCVRDGDTLIDGRNRHAACQQLGIETKWIEYRDVVKKRGTQLVGEDEYPLPSEYILAINRDRRQLSEDQMTMVAAKWSPIYRAEAEERKRAAASKAGKASGVARSSERTCVPNETHVQKPKPKPRRSDDEAAKMAGVSRRKIRQAMELQATAPELAAQVEAGKMKLREAVKAMPRPVDEEKPQTEPWIAVWNKFSNLEKEQQLKFVSHLENNFKP